MVLDGDLRKKQPTLLAPGNEQAMPADLDIFVADGNWRRKQGYFDVKMRQVFRAHWRKARVLESGAHSAPDNRFPERLVWFDYSDAAAETPSNMQSYENAHFFSKNTIGWNIRKNPSPRHGFHHRLTRQFQKRIALGLREGQHPQSLRLRFACGFRECPTFGAA